MAGRTTVVFRAELAATRSGGHYVLVPDELAAAAGLRFRDRVRGVVGGVAYRSSLARYGGDFHLGLTTAVLAAAGVAPGSEIELSLEADPEPPPGERVPDDLAAAIAASPAARTAVAAMAPSHRREHVKFVEEAKRPDTRARRIVATVAALEAYAGARPAGARPKAEAKTRTRVRAEPKAKTRAEPKAKTRAKPKPRKTQPTTKPTARPRRRATRR